MVKQKVGKYFDLLKLLVFYFTLQYSGWIFNSTRFVIDRYSVPQPLNHRTSGKTILFEKKGILVVNKMVLFVPILT